MSIVLQGSTSGSITLQEPAIAGSNTINLPAATGTAVLTGVSGTVDINAAGSNNVTLSTNSTERMRITSGGVLELTSGQLKFPATQSASSDANTLDDYEEGTWTPVVGSVTLTEKGRYTKIGRLVHVSFANQTGIAAVNVNATVTCSGLPFSIVSSNWDNTDAAVVMWNNESISYRDELACGRIFNNSLVSLTNKGSETTTTADPWTMSLTYYTS